jgi:hypothetical protein
VLAVWAADCAERTLSLFEKEAPLDPRPRAAINGLRAFARGELKIGPMKKLSIGAHTAARSVDHPAAIAAARAAGQAAATAHMATNAREASGYTAKAAGLASADSEAAATNELVWHVRHASPRVREVLRRLPPPERDTALLARLVAELDSRVRSVAEDVLEPD